MMEEKRVCKPEVECHHDDLPKLDIGGRKLLLGVLTLLGVVCSIVCLQSFQNDFFPSIHDDGRTRLSRNQWPAQHGSTAASETPRKLSMTSANETNRRSGSIRTMALIRPFGTEVAPRLASTFDEWDKHPPCDPSSFRPDGNGKDGEGGVAVDVFLSFSQTYKSHPVATSSVKSVIDLFQAKRRSSSSSSWGMCFRNVHPIEAGIDPEDDLYLPDQADRNAMWVNGPNRQFSTSLSGILSGEFGHYDAVFIMESDSIPVKDYWLQSLLEEAEENSPFAILGSKYDGDAWDEFRSSLPLALQHHINGNAVYNISHPLLQSLLGQLESESKTPYNSVPYDYRMSQILVEGMLGVAPELPPKVVREYQSAGKELPQNMEKFQQWWQRYGDGQNPIRQSTVIANYARTNLLPRHIENEAASIIHGAKSYLPWDGNKHEITLVVSEWSNLSSALLKSIDNADHPFSHVLVVLPDITENVAKGLSRTDSSVEVTFHKRSHPDHMDLCMAPVTTEWFMITTSFHVVADHVDLMFDNDPRRRPVIRYTPADELLCFKYPSCLATYELSKRFDPMNNKIVHDFDMLFRTEERNEFCKLWIERNGEAGEMLHDLGEEEESSSNVEDGPQGPTSTDYVSYLQSREGRANEMYVFMDRTYFGAREYFVRKFELNVERTADEERSWALADRILQGAAPSLTPAPASMPTT